MNHLQRLATALGTTLVGGALLAGATFAWPGPFEGRPDGLHPGGDLGYWIWQDDGGLHVRATGPGPRHLFNAAIQTNGQLRDVRLAQLEGDDVFLVSDAGHQLHLHFETW